MNRFARQTRNRIATGPFRVAASVLAWWVVSYSVPAPAQNLPPSAGRLSGQTADQDNPFEAVVHPSEEGGTLLKRAEEGIEHQDWKLAIDSLQRLIELQGEHVLTSDGQLYESARRWAVKRLVAMPEAGRRAYRLVHDGEASALFEQARQQHDKTLMKSVVDRFLLTSIGPQAAVTLADWTMDEGRFAEAVSVLGWVLSLRPASDLPAWVVPARLAVALAASGQQGLASRLVSEFGTTQAAGSAPAWSDHAGSISAYLAGKSSQDTLREVSAWPWNQGNDARDGRMDSVEPAFPPELAWRVALPIVPPREGFETLHAFAVSQGLWPAAQPVTDGRSLYLKAGPQLLALDVETFEPIWTAQPHTPDQVLRFADRPFGQGWAVVSPGQSAEQYANHPWLLRLYQDSVGSSVALAFGQVLTVEWPGDPPPVPVLWLEDGRPNLVRGRFEPGYLTPNRVAAYAPDTGKLLWSTDTAGGESDLASVQFLAVPIPVGRFLVAPVRVQSDLYAVLLEPRTGRLARYVYLCGAGGGGFNSLHACDPCVADGTLYLPTGRGVLAALDAADLSVRWLMRYDRVTRKRHADSWRTPQVVAAADVVLLAPLDADQLLCLDRATARIRWSADRGRSQYILAADDRRVWLAGQQVQAVDLATGQPVWSRSIAPPTGRGVLAGDRLYLPTETGLAALDAATGRPIDVDKPLAGDRLGNLLAFDTALYSMGTLSLRKFPDLRRGYERAVRIQQADPSDGAHAIRRAALELLQERPSEALAVLERVPAAFARQDPGRHQHLIHLKVAAMLRLAAADATTPERGLKLLQEARQIAPTARDAIDSALALADLHARRGKPLDSCMEYLSLMLSEAGDELLADNEGFQRRARDMAGERLSILRSKLSPADARTLADRMDERLRWASARRDERALLWLSECAACGAIAHQASLLLAGWAVDGLRFEQAETILSRVLRQAEAPPLRAEAAARLTGIYLQPEDMNLPVAAAGLIERLKNEFASVPLPAALAGGTAADQAARPPAGTLTGAELAARLGRRLDEKRLARHREALAPARLGPPRIPTAMPYLRSRPVIVRDEPQEPLLDKHLLLTDSNVLEVHDSASGKLIWPAELRLLGELTVESQIEQQSLRRDFTRSGYNTAARALLQGQTLLISSPLGIHALGALTGRRLWSRPFDAPYQAGQEPLGSDAWFWADEGYAVSVDARGRLEVFRAESGNRVLWRRTDPRRHWHWVRTRQGVIAAMDGDLERVDLSRLHDGRALGSCLFTQPADKVNITLFADVICGPVSEREIAAFELATPGVQRWRFTTPGTIAQLFKPSPDMLAVSDRGARLTLIDPATGTTRWQSSVEVCADGLVDGIVQEGTLYVCGLQQRPGGPRPNYESQRWGIAALRWSDGQVLWQHGNLPARSFLNADVLRCSSNAIPVAALVPDQSPRPGGPIVMQREGSVPAPSGHLELTVLDKTTGQLLGNTVKVNLSAGLDLVVDVRAGPGIVEVVLGSSDLLFDCPPADK